jgi:hypothetical protein
MTDGLYLYCQRLFQRSRFRPHQFVCGQPDCQWQRRRDYHRRRIETTGGDDIVFRVVTTADPS